jgi:hypothetical protein
MDRDDIRELIKEYMGENITIDIGVKSDYDGKNLEITLRWGYQTITSTSIPLSLLQD